MQVQIASVRRVATAPALEPQEPVAREELSALLVKASHLFFYALVLSAPFSQRWIVLEREVALYQEFAGVIVYLSDIALLFTVLLWLTAHIINPSRKLSLGPLFATIPLSACVSVSLASISWATFQPVAAETALRMLLLLGLYLFVLNEEIAAKGALTALMLGVLLQSGIAILQFILQSHLGLGAIGELNVGPNVPNASIVQADGRFWLRGYGLTSNPNILGGYLAVGLLATLGRYLSAGRRASTLLLTCIAIGTAGLIVTFSRSAWLGFALGFLFFSLFICFNHSYRKLLTVRMSTAAGIMGLMWVVFILWFPALFGSRILLPLGSTVGSLEKEPQHAEIRDLDQRTWEQSAALKVVQHNTLLGVGAGNFSLGVYQQTRDNNYVVQPVHSVPLLIVSELGIPGAGLAGAILVTPFVGIWRSRKALSQSFYLFLWSGAFIAVLVIGIFDYYLWGSQYGRPLLWTVFGLWAAHLLRGGGQLEKCA